MAEVQVGEEVTELWCRHWFHSDCIRPWLETHNSCPHCRMSIEDAKRAHDERDADPKSKPDQGKKRAGSSSWEDSSSSRNEPASGSSSSYQPPPSHNTRLSSLRGAFTSNYRSAAASSDDPTQQHSAASDDPPASVPDLRRSHYRPFGGQPRVPPHMSGARTSSASHRPHSEINLRLTSLTGSRRNSSPPPTSRHSSRRSSRSYESVRRRDDGYLERRRTSRSDRSDRSDRRSREEEHTGVLGRVRDWIGGHR